MGHGALGIEHWLLVICYRLLVDPHK